MMTPSDALQGHPVTQLTTPLPNLVSRSCPRYNVAMFKTITICLVMILMLGCASPAYRIKKNPEIFAAFPAEVQANVREGRVEVGYTAAMVLIAMGKPSRIYTRQSEDGASRIWSYAHRRHTSSLRQVETMRVYRDKHGRRHHRPDVRWVDVGGYTEYEAVRIEFLEDVVKAIEVLER